MATIRGKRDVRLAALAALLMLAGAVRPAAMPARVAARASTAPSPIPGATAAPVENRVNDTYGSLPLVFVPNGGRTNSQVSFWAQAGGARFYFTPSEAVFAFTKDDRGLALRLSFINANPAPQIVGTRPGPGKVNYLVGSDPRQWHTGISTYGEVVYRDLWPGIDVAFRGDSGQLNYEFHVAAWADPGNIRLAYRGADRISLGPGGELLIHAGFGVLRDSPPVSYQLVAGDRVPLASRYALAGSSYGIVLGSYDPSQPLVIDPSLAYSTYLGGGLGIPVPSTDDSGEAIAVDSEGNAYVTGFTLALDFPTTAGSFNPTPNCPCPNTHAFVTKLNATGTALIYSTFLDTSTRGEGIAVDMEGNAYVTGQTQSPNFPTTTGAFDTTHNGAADTFVAKLDAMGATLLYSTYLGGGGNEQFHAIALEQSGNAYVTGATSSVNFPTTPGAFDTTLNGAARRPGCVCDKGRPDRSHAPLLHVLGAFSLDRGQGIATDAQGSAYVTGITSSTDFPTTEGAFDRTFNGAAGSGGFDVFVTKLDPSGAALVYSTFLGGSSSQGGRGLRLIPRGTHTLRA